MTTAGPQHRGSGRQGGGQNSMLLELIDRILDKGIVIDAWARVSVLSIELLTVEARVVVASVETYLRYAEAIGNTALASMPHPQQTQQPQTAAMQQPQVGAQQAQQALPQPQQANMMPQRQAQPAQQTQQIQPQQAQGQPQQTQQPQPQQRQQQQVQPQQG